MNSADYSLKYIGNINEMPIAFDLPYSTTLDHCGISSIVNIKTTSHEKINFTVILAYMANDLKKKQTNLAIIPDNLICKLQLLDVAINKSFKVKKSWRDVNISIIQRFFKYCRISTARDGNEVCNVDELDENYDEGYDSNYRKSNSNNSDSNSKISNNDSDEVNIG
ncbi:unnamed protein product [Rhizophagus irregularis]|nr:unnamed protein product [Rhizophagus irregularis]